MALGGLVAVLLVLAFLPPFGQPAPRWAWRFFLAWCLGVPYWHFLEYRFLLPRDADDRVRADFLYQQALSRAAWIGVALVLATFLLAGSRA